MERSEIKAMQDYRITEQIAGGTLEMEMFQVAITQAEANQCACGGNPATDGPILVHSWNCPLKTRI